MKDLAGRLAALTPAQRTQLTARLGVQPAKLESIAILGIGCRFPGGADSPEAFWQRLCEGFDAVQTVPFDRWDAAAQGISASPWGAFLDRVDLFDHEFFGLSPREVTYMDPQQASPPGDRMGGARGRGPNERSPCRERHRGLHRRP